MSQGDTQMACIPLGVMALVFAMALATFIETGAGLGAMVGSSLLGVPLALIILSRVRLLRALRSQLHDIRIIEEHERERR